jgi:hypothetical protein
LPLKVTICLSGTGIALTVLDAVGEKRGWGRGGEAFASPLIERWVFDCGLNVWCRGLFRAKSLKCATTTLRYWRFETRFFASFLFAFEKK